MATTAKIYHGVAVSIASTGILIQGPAGSGKSELALGLLDRQHLLIADDSVKINNNLIMQSEPPKQGYLYIRDLGLLDINKLYPKQLLLHGSRLELVITLQNHPTAVNESLSPKLNFVRIQQKQVANIHLCRYSNIDMSLKLETLVKQYRLIKSGHCTGQKFLTQLPA